MVEYREKIYLYDRWFEKQSETKEKTFYISIPKNSMSSIKIEMDKIQNTMTLYNIENNKVISRIEITDITMSTIEMHCIQEIPKIIEMGQHNYDNLVIELFTTITNNSIPHDFQLKIIKTNKKSNFIWVDPPLPLDEKMDLDDIDADSKFVNDFIDYASAFSRYIRELQDILLSEKQPNKIQNSLTVKEITIPQELMVYDRVYHLTNVKDNKIVLANDEDGIRNLEIKYDPTTFSLLSVKLIIGSNDNIKGIMQIIPNELNGVTVRLCNKKSGKVLLGNETIPSAKIHSNIVYDDNSQKIEHEISIKSQNRKIELLEHPYIRNNFTDGKGNLYTVRDATYAILGPIASFAPGIYHLVEKKLFKEKKEDKGY